MRRILCAVLFLLVLSARAAYGQQNTAVSGTIVDPNGVPYAGARVQAILVSPGGQSPSLTPCNNPQSGCQIQNPGAVTVHLSRPRRNSVARNKFHRLQITGCADLQAHPVVLMVGDGVLPLLGEQQIPESLTGSTCLHPHITAGMPHGATNRLLSPI